MRRCAVLTCREVGKVDPDAIGELSGFAMNFCLAVLNGILLP